MIQFYFLSISLNIIGGFLLASEYLFNKFSGLSAFDGLTSFFENNPVRRFILGCFCFFVGILKFISVIKGDIPVVGDLLPALFGVLIGFILIYEFYKERSKDKMNEAPSPMDSLQATLLKYKNAIGIAGIIISVFHFILPRVLFL